MRHWATVGLALIGLIQTGCVRRTITVLSDPPGAIVWLNDREIGRTPVTVDFLFYGRYDVRLLLDGYEPLQTSGEAEAPLWDVIGVDLVSEAVPGEPRANVVWKFVLSPREQGETGVLDRAAALRARVEPASSQPDKPVEEPGATVPDAASLATP